ncbi:MAG TPA: hypothetical protein VHX44_09150 [Planctomycetota bacterium]|nr:hypothetical protein [Planctomycetota bacterium]
MSRQCGDGLSQGWFCIIAIFALTGCHDRASSVPLYTTIEALALAMTTAVNQNDISAYAACFTFTANADLSAEFAPDDASAWKRAADDRVWLSQRLAVSGAMDGAKNMRLMPPIRVRDGKAAARFVIQDPGSAARIITMNAVLTDNGWRFVLVRSK